MNDREQEAPDSLATGLFDCPNCGAKLAIKKSASAPIKQSRISWTPDPRIQRDGLGWVIDGRAGGTERLSG